MESSLGLRRQFSMNYVTPCEISSKSHAESRVKRRWQKPRWATLAYDIGVNGRPMM